MQVPISIIQQTRRLDAQRGAGRTQFALADSGQFIGRAQRRVATRTSLAVRKGQHFDAHAMPGQQSQRPTRAEGFVIGMGEDG